MQLVFSQSYGMEQHLADRNEWPLFRLRADGAVEELGVVVPGPADGFAVHLAGDRPNLARAPDGDATATFPGLPWYLDDLRPQGFLSKARGRSRCGAPALSIDPEYLRPGALLALLAHTGGTGAGDLLPGMAALHAALAARESPPDLVHEAERPRMYAERATSVMGGTTVQFGPGGEQPKFTATVQRDGKRNAVLVKFARADASDAAARWADLLVCEHLALQCLRNAGIDASASNLILTRSHTFLEVQRFDRTPDLLGRRGFVSLLSLSAAFVGDVTADWGKAGEQVQALDWVTQDTATHMARLYAFGRLIGNSDMHEGNVGFHLTDDGPLPLAPVYDMLPMSLAPSRTGVLRPVAPIGSVAQECGGQLAHLQWAGPLAEDFWERVAGSALLRSATLRQVAAENARRVRTMGQRFK